MVPVMLVWTLVVGEPLLPPCSQPPPFAETRIIGPAADQTEVPLDASIWVVSSTGTTARLFVEGTPQVIETRAEVVAVFMIEGRSTRAYGARSELALRFVPLEPLAAGTRYNVEVQTQSGRREARGFRTGRSAAASPPAAPRVLGTETDTRGSRCEDDFALGVRVEADEGTVLVTEVDGAVRGLAAPPLAQVLTYGPGAVTGSVRALDLAGQSSPSTPFGGEVEPATDTDPAGCSAAGTAPAGATLLLAVLAVLTRSRRVRGCTRS